MAESDFAFVLSGLCKVSLKLAHPRAYPTSRYITKSLYKRTPTTQQCKKQPKMTRYTASGYDSVYNTTNHFYNAGGGCSVDKDRSQILTWLSPLKPMIQHQEVQERRVGDVGGWLMQREEFRRWNGLEGESEGGNPVLFCYGAPGVGKTFIR